MNYASLYNMRSCFTVKRGGDPERSTSTARNKEERERERVVASRWTDRDIVKRRRRRKEGGGGGGGINFAIGEFYVRAAAIYYGGAKLPVSCVWHRYPASICIRLRIHLLHPLITDFWLIQFFPFTVCSTKVFDFVFIAGMIYWGGINRICNLIARVMAKSLANERKISKQFVILIYGLAKIFPIMRGKSWLISVYIA